MEALTISSGMAGALELLIILGLTLGLLVLAAGAIIAVAMIVRGKRGKPTPPATSSAALHV